MPTTDSLLKLAVDLANEAGAAILEIRSEAIVSHETKSSPTDPVTAGDRAAEDIVVKGILGARPDDGVIGEEGTNQSGTSGVDWYVDPIDGTTNYLYGIPAFSVSIAASVQGEPAIAVVFNPSLDELFTAVHGQGAFLNGESIRASSQVDFSSALIGTGFGYQADRRLKQAELVTRLLPQIRDIRRFGSAALDLCAVACGRLDAYYEEGLNIWDFAAGCLIASEAGAVCSDLEGGPATESYVIAATAAVHQPLLDVLKPS